MVTVELLKSISVGTIFRTGISFSSDLVASYGDQGSGYVKWVAVRGIVEDWAIYVGPAYWDDDKVKNSGNKIYRQATIEDLVLAEKEAYRLYRY